MNDMMWIIILGSILLAVAVIGAGAIWIVMRRRFIRFADDISTRLDCLMEGGSMEEFSANDETLESKIQMQLVRLEGITSAAVKKNELQKKEIQKMVSDISHQLKTPIANITMYNDTIMKHDLPKEKEKEFRQIMQGQVEKLDFLVKSLVKMSRLENNLIAVKKEPASLADCIRKAVEEISLSAGKKEIQLDIIAEEDLRIPFDRKWTLEAIVNILDNGVKYTPIGGRVTVTLEGLVMFAKITIQDTGIGFEQEHANDIFKRFFREKKVHNQPGIGIGLALTRQIISLQGGYMKASSKPDRGSTFTIYLPRT